MTMTLPFECFDQRDLVLQQVARAAAKGLRPAERWEIEWLGPEDLFVSGHGGPVYVRVASHGARAFDVDAFLAKTAQEPR